jgi:hypothetical protein
MLVIKAFVNHDQIDEVWIHNMGYIDHCTCQYRIEKPEGYEDDLIHHKRSDGWYGLAEKAMKLLYNKRSDGWNKMNAKVLEELYRYDGLQPDSK